MAHAAARGRANHVDAPSLKPPLAPYVAANFIVGFGAPETVTVATGDGRAEDAGAAAPVSEIVKRCEREYMAVAPESRSRTK